MFGSSESARKLPNYFIKNEAKMRASEIEKPEFPGNVVRSVFNHVSRIFSQNDGKKILIPFSGGKDSLLTVLFALEIFKKNPENVILFHEEKSSSPEERRMIEIFEKEYGIQIERKQAGTEDFFSFEPTDWGEVEDQFISRHSLTEALVKEKECILVEVGNLTEYLLGLFTPTESSSKNKELEPISILFASEVGKMLRQFDVPRELALQKSFTTETKQEKERVLGADYKVIDAALWLKLHTPDVEAIARALKVNSSWLKELFTKRILNRKEVIEPLLKKAWEDPLSMGGASDEFRKQLADYRWAGIRSLGISLSNFSLDNEPNLKTFYEGI